MQKANGEGNAATGSDGLRRSVAPEAGTVVRANTAQRVVASGQSAMGGTSYNQATTNTHTQNRSVPRTLHRVSFSASQVDALAKREALIELKKSGFNISNEMQFAQSSVVLRRDDGGLDVEVSV